MNFRSHITAALVLTATLLALSACAPTIRIKRLKPARVNAAAHLSKITVLTFEGQGGERLSSRLKEALEDIYVDGEPYFSIVGEDTFYKLASSQKCGACRGEKHILSLAAATGADAVLAGSVTQDSCTAELYEKKETRCIRRTILEKNENPVCTQWADFFIPCVRNTATYEFEVRLVEIETGQYLYTDSFGSTRQNRACLRNRHTGSYRASLIELTDSRLASRQCRAEWKRDLINRAYEDAVARAEKKITRNIAPYYESAKIPIMTSAAGISDAKSKTLFARAIKLAKNRNLTKACTLWKEAGTMNPDAPSLNYNLGVCAEFKNELGRAEELYRRSAALLGGANDMMLAAFKRIDRNKKDMNVLERQLDEQSKNRNRKKTKRPLPRPGAQEGTTK